MPTRLFDQLLAKSLTRKEFVVHLGLLAVALTGITGLLRTISNPDLLTHRKTVSSGFGSGVYGGRKRASQGTPS